MDEPKRLGLLRFDSLLGECEVAGAVDAELFLVDDVDAVAGDDPEAEVRRVGEDRVLGYHNGREVREPGGDVGHHRGVDDAERLSAVYAAVAVDDGPCCYR